MTSRSIKPIETVSAYFGNPYFVGIPIITQEFTPGQGWKLTGYKKRVSRSWLRKLKGEGVTHVTLTLDGRSPDFSIEELLQRDRRPMFTGNLIGAAIKSR